LPPPLSADEVTGHGPKAIGVDVASANDLAYPATLIPITSLPPSLSSISPHSLIAMLAAVRDRHAVAQMVVCVQLLQKFEYDMSSLNQLMCVLSQADLLYHMLYLAQYFAFSAKRQCDFHDHDYLQRVDRLGHLPDNLSNLTTRPIFDWLAVKFAFMIFTVMDCDMLVESMLHYGAVYDSVEAMKASRIQASLCYSRGNMKLIAVTNVANEIRQINVNSLEAIDAFWGHKANSGATEKINICVAELLIGLKQHDNKYFLAIVNDLTYSFGLSNDMLCAVIIWHAGQWHNGHCFTLRSVIALLCHPLGYDIVGAVNDVCKRCGAASNPILANYCELNCLFGRAFVATDLEADFNLITHPSVTEGHDVHIASDVIYRLAYDLFGLECDALRYHDVSYRWNKYDYTIDAYWTDRQINCVNGAHHVPSALEHKYGKVAGVISMTRMVFLESVKDNFMYLDPPMVESTMSIKAEAPKCRILKASDTIAYVNEDYVQRYVDRCWGNRHVLLSPGLQTRAQEADRVRAMQGEWSVMLDYSSMDHIHSIASMREVIQARNDWFGVPKDINDYLVAMEDNVYVRYQGVHRKVTYGLLTGRRTTTFTNSVLNYCYVHMILNSIGITCVDEIYTGDDSIITFNTIEEAFIFRNACLNSQFKFNQHKIAIGRDREFLRHSVNAVTSCGYVARAIASFVCGSWVNKIMLAPQSDCTIYSRYAWTIKLRGGYGPTVDNCLVYALHHRTHLPFECCQGIVSASQSVNGSPCLNQSGDIINYLANARTATRVVKWSDMPSYATDDHVGSIASVQSTVLTPHELKALHYVYLKASYQHGLTVGYDTLPVAVEHYRYTLSRQIVKYNVIKNAWPGLVNQIPVLAPTAFWLSERDMGILVKSLSNNVPMAGYTLNYWLFGIVSRPIVSILNYNYDDLMVAAKAYYSNRVTTIMRYEYAQPCHY